MWAYAASVSYLNLSLNLAAWRELRISSWVVGFPFSFKLLQGQVSLRLVRRTVQTTAQCHCTLLPTLWKVWHLQPGICQESTVGSSYVRWSPFRRLIGRFICDEVSTNDVKYDIILYLTSLGSTSSSTACDDCFCPKSDPVHRWSPLCVRKTP